MVLSLGNITNDSRTRRLFTLLAAGLTVLALTFGLSGAASAAPIITVTSVSDTATIDRVNQNWATGTVTVTCSEPVELDVINFDIRQKQGKNLAVGY